MTSFKTALAVVLTATAIFYARKWCRPRVPTDVNGFCLPAFAGVKEAFRENLESGAERGGAFAVYHKGELVCDLWGGFADEHIEYPWQENTVSVYFSATKAVAAFCVLIMADRKLLDLNDPIAKHWPEFAQNGKENITVKMLLGHQAGLAAVDETYSIRLIKTDPDKIGRILAAQKPNWPPGSVSGYHALTYGLYIDQLVRRADKKHRGIDQFFREEVAIPFDIDLSFGLAKEEHYRAARFQEFPYWEVVFRSFMDPVFRYFVYNIFTDPVAQSAANLEDIHKVSRYIHMWPDYKEIPHGSMYGYGTARGMAKLYGTLANDGKLGQRQLLSSATTPKLTELLFSGVDRILGVHRNVGHGVFLNGIHEDDHPGMFGMPGYGGQIGYGDTKHKLGWAYLTAYPHLEVGDNFLHYRNLRKAVYAVVS